jgi:hypothetical protein
MTVESAFLLTFNLLPSILIFLKSKYIFFVVDEGMYLLQVIKFSCILLTNLNHSNFLKYLLKIDAKLLIAINHSLLRNFQKI